MTDSMNIVLIGMFILTLVQTYIMISNRQKNAQVKLNDKNIPSVTVKNEPSMQKYGFIGMWLGLICMLMGFIVGPFVGEYMADAKYALLVAMGGLFGFGICMIIGGYIDKKIQSYKNKILSNAGVVKE